MRLDGLVTKLKEREKRVNLFQKDESYNVFLLTTQVSQLPKSALNGRLFVRAVCCILRAFSLHAFVFNMFFLY